MRVMILILVLALAIIAVPVAAQDYGTTSPPAASSSSSTPSDQATPAPSETPAPSMEAAPAPSMAPQPAPPTSTMTTTTSMSSMTDSEPLVVATVIRYYNIDPATAAQLQAKGYTARDFAMLGNLSSRTGKPVSEFVGLRSQNMSWSDIASRYQVSMSDMIVPTAMMMSPEVDAYNRQFANQYFGISDAEITALRAQGMPWGQIYMTANLAHRANQPVSQIAALHSQGLSWVEIGSRYSIASADISSPFMMTGRVAGVAAQVGPMAWQAPIYDRAGSVVLTQRDAWVYRRLGYSWSELAFASNISRRACIPIDVVLRSVDAGKTYTRIALDYGVDTRDAMDYSDYPFTHEPWSRTDRQQMKRM
jgi:hypothetical protein